MSKVSRYCFLLAVAGCLLLAQPLMAAEGIKGNLVNVNWLEKNLKNADVLILDASPTQIYTTKHIPGAVSVDIYTWYGLQEMPVADMEKLCQSWGISSGKKIVMYDPGGTMLATRLFFSLYYYGFPARDLLILDGGLFRWEEQGLPVTKDITPAPKQGSFKIKKLYEDVKVNLPEFLTASGDSVNNVLLEALGVDWHFGEVLAFPRAGHIPNGILLPSADFYNPDKTFKSAEDIRRMLTYLGVRPEQQIYTYCGGGVAASVPFFALKFLVNYPKVKLYKESELGWLSDERELPYWTYDAPFLMRETYWLQFWGGQRIRTFGGGHVSIVDVRPAGAFDQGHVPFALNLPADVMLEKLGQKKVSVFMDSMEKWAKLGFALTKDATVVGPKKVLQDLSVPPTTYPGNFRKDVIIADPKSTRGYYPKVFIASGKDVPAKAQNGKVVHVPYTDLLNADGMPKAAKDIWNILAKAGVPRYAELVCFSDDPGEAAANYFILKLMGYPDIKVLVI
ncbi:MAG: rhodanese-like domain-containing protein [Candidatus Aminicenantes bacterium]|nr:rhodanese-like domain-containing protein [Candidatus Aminicenantes bacterium]